jgi:glycerol kinase
VDLVAVLSIPALAPEPESDTTVRQVNISKGDDEFRVRIKLGLDLLRAMEADSGIFPETLRVDGGLVANSFVCQFLSDMLQAAVELPAVTETTALGAAYLAGLHAGIYKDLQGIMEKWVCAKRYEPRMEKAERDALYDAWSANLALFLGK